MKAKIVGTLLLAFICQLSYAENDLLIREITYRENPHYNPAATAVPDSDKSHIMEGYIYNRIDNDVYNVRFYVEFSECISDDECFLISEQVIPALAWGETIDPSILYFGSRKPQRNDFVIPTKQRRAFKGLIFIPADSNKTVIRYSYEVK